MSDMEESVFETQPTSNSSTCFEMADIQETKENEGTNKATGVSVAGRQAQNEFEKHNVNVGELPINPTSAANQVNTEPNAEVAGLLVPISSMHDLVNAFDMYEGMSFNVIINPSVPAREYRNLRDYLDRRGQVDIIKHAREEPFWPLYVAFVASSVRDVVEFEIPPLAHVAVEIIDCVDDYDRIVATAYIRGFTVLNELRFKKPITSAWYGNLPFFISLAVITGGIFSVFFGGALISLERFSFARGWW